jgi:adenylate kinase family enzyme
MKLYITGGPGSGKSTYARKLSKEHSIPCFDLDNVKWINDSGVHFVNARTNEERVKIIADIINNNNDWIFEGAYFENWMHKILEQSDEVIVLNVPRWTRHWRCLKREIKRFDPKYASISSIWGLFCWNHTYDSRYLTQGLEKMKRERVKYRTISYGCKTSGNKE